MKFIPLSQGYKAIVDNEDYLYLAQFKWYARNAKNGIYAVRNNNKHTVQMHRIILNAPKNKMVDHCNSNSLDNRKKNLRLCTRSQNLMNSKKPKKKGLTSKYKGVHKIQNKSPKHNKIWRASLRLNKKLIHLGDFETEKEAALSYNAGALKYFGLFASINKL